MTGLLQTAQGVLGRRMLTTTWLPVLAFGTGLVALTAGGTGWGTALRRWEGLGVDVRTTAVLLFVTATALLSQLLAAARPSVIKLFEGYWDGIPLGRRCALRLSARRPGVDTARPWTAPTPERLMPTRFGNVLRAAEQAAERYGMDAVTAWPRLYTVLPDAFRASLATAAGTLDLMVTISMLGAVFTVAGTTVAALLLPWQAAPVCAVAGLVVARLGYRGAVHAAAPYGDLVRSAFDVHRWLLIDAMGLQRPGGYAEELAQWRQIHQLWQRGHPDSGSAWMLGYPPKENGTFRYPAERGGPTATGRLPAFHILSPHDLEPPATDLVGRYTLRTIDRGEPVAPDALGPALGAEAFRGRLIAALRTRSTPLEVAPGDRVRLVGIPESGSPYHATDVVVLARPGDESLVALLPQSDLDVLLPMQDVVVSLEGHPHGDH
ncbi:hypothetical protein ACIPSA_44925 [Streptomyces sp. NPDC086549]|uniref:hypothetical protein n=1 Tax=Streptomyces sp. NPDC086549 TaxID=3365752 RepID=UPI003817A8FA